MDPSAAELAAAAVPGDSDDDVIVDSADAKVARTVAKITALQDKVSDLRGQLERARREAVEVAEAKAKQQQRRAAEEKATARIAEQVRKQHSDLEKARKRYSSLLLELNQLRLRDTVLDYAERLRKDGDGPALDFLTKMINMVSEPSKLLADVARLRAQHRNKMCDWLKESGAAKHQLNKVQRELEEQTQFLTRLATGKSGGLSDLKKQRLK